MITSFNGPVAMLSIELPVSGRKSTVGVDPSRVSIVPAQAKHTPVTGLYVGNRFGAERLDTVTEAEFCIPSQVGAP